jgi:hypothetical protein
MHFLQCGLPSRDHGGAQRDKRARLGSICFDSPCPPLPTLLAACAFATRFQTFAAGMTATHDVLLRFAFFAAQHASDVTIRLLNSSKQPGRRL